MVGGLLKSFFLRPGVHSAEVANALGLAVSAHRLQLPKAISSAHSNVHTPTPLSPPLGPVLPSQRLAKRL